MVDLSEIASSFRHTSGGIVGVGRGRSRQVAIAIGILAMLPFLLHPFFVLGHAANPEKSPVPTVNHIRPY
jgi:hypothetical protein